ncbi:MAG: exonuclease domain-containing protein [Bacteroidota bacterium]|nr:exonuclease domain-containing protein [Bacteroidota bacterium]
MYTIIDIETTGGRPQFDKITEIAIYVHDGNKITDKFESLVNPEQTIPYFITGLTGITNEMVEDAPRFYELAKTIIELTEGNVFVAHNASFDYGFIREEFKNLGYTFKRDILDTVKLSRRLIPGLRSYSLGKLCDEVNIQIKDRHRAAGDALATVKLFELLLSLDQSKKLFQKQALPDLHPMLKHETIQNLPEEAGVYYFSDENMELLYIGKSKNIHQRVLNHLANRSSRKTIEMRDRIASIDYELTGSDLIACLLESYEIKLNKPVYNRAQRRESSYSGIFADYDKKGYLKFKIGKNHADHPLASFSSVEKARNHISRLSHDHNLCQKLTGLYETSGPCFQHQIGICAGACIGKETPQSYNIRAEKARKSFEYEHRDFLLFNKGRTKDEKSVVKVENGKYMGYGYFHPDDTGNNLELIQDSIKNFPDNRDIQSIIKRFIRKNDIEKIVLL